MQAQMVSNSKSLLSSMSFSPRTRTTIMCQKTVSVPGLAPLSNKLIHIRLALANLFSGEEAYGKYLDLYANHVVYNNLKSISRRLGYLHYLDALIQAENGLVHSELSKETLLTKDYEAYVLPEL